MDSLLLEPPRGYLRYLEFPGEALPVVWLHGLGGAASSDFAPVVANPALAGHRSLLIATVEPQLGLRSAQAILLLCDRLDERSIAFDDLQLVKL